MTVAVCVVLRKHTAFGRDGMAGGDLKAPLL